MGVDAVGKNQLSYCLVGSHKLLYIPLLIVCYMLNLQEI